MKANKIIIPTLLAMMLTSCGATSYFQVYKTVPSEKVVIKDNLLIYEDENCEISYNLWDNGGNIGFQFFNKTDKNIYLNLEESFFVLNGISYNYYKNRIFTNSESLGSSNSRALKATQSVTGLNFVDLFQTNKISETNTSGTTTSSGFSVSYHEENIITIPSKTSKIVSEYNINESLFRDCDLLKYPTKKQVKSKSFSKSQSPFVFSNRIAYFFDKPDNLIKLENEFYVSEISNFPENEILESKHEEYCGQKSMTMKKYFKNVSADKFYIKYSKGQDSFKN